MKPLDRFADAAFVVVLSAAGLLPLATSFAGFGWAVAGGVAIICGVLLAERSAAWHWPGPVFVLAALVVFVVLAAPAPSVTRELGEMLPTPNGLAEVFRNSMRGWGDLIGTLPRIDSAGPVMVVPVILGLFASASAMGLAVRTRSAAAPAVPLIAMFVASLALGRGETSNQLATGVGFSLLALYWVSLRSGRRTGGARLLAGLVVLALAGTLAPALAGGIEAGSSRLVLRETAARGFDTTRIDTPLRAFRRFTRQAPGTKDNVHRRVLLRVTGLPAGERLRFAVLDWYDGEQWRPNPDRSPQDSRARYLRLSSTIDNPAPGVLQRVEVDVRRAWRSHWVPTVGALQAFEFSGFRSGDRREELVYNPDTRVALLGQVLRGVDDYRFSARVADQTLRADMVAARGVDEQLYLRASFLDGIARAYRDRARTPMQALFAAADGLKRRGRYSNGASAWEARRFPAGHGLDRLDQQFLHARQMVGDDEQYAATMALLAIRLGIPARVVVGAVTPPNGKIRGDDVHAWIEVQLADGSWRTMPTSRFMSHKPPRRKVPGGHRAVPIWQPPAQAAEPPPEHRDSEEPPTKKKPRPDPAGDEGPPIGWLVVVALLVGAVPVAKVIRRRRRRTHGRPSARAAAAWAELSDAARDLGHERTPGQTRPEEAMVLGTAADLADAVDRAVFAAAPPDDPDLAALWERSGRLRRELSRSAPRWRRVSAPFNPVGLVGHRRDLD